MKKLIALILTAIMLISAIPFGTLAAGPEKECLNLCATGPYSYYNVSLNANDSVVSFDLAMTPDSNGEPTLVFSYIVSITPTAVTIGSKSTGINWGAVELKHWRHVDLKFSSGSLTVALDGVDVATGNASCPTSGFYFLGYPGVLNLDNLVATSMGNVVMNVVFEDENEYLRFKNKDSTAVRGNVAEGSYYDYSPVVVPDNVNYIFDSASACEKLSVGSGIEKLRGDLNDDGEVNGRDSRILKGLIVGDSLGSYSELIADVNADGEVSSRDSLLMKKIIVGTADPIPVTVDGGGASAVFSPMAQGAELSASKTATDGVDAELILDESIDPEAYKYAVITYMTPYKVKEGDVNSEAAKQSAFGAWGNFVTYSITNDGEYHSETVDLSGISTWNGDSATFRFFVAANEGDRIFVDSIIFCATKSKADAAVSARATAKKGVTWKDAGTSPEPPTPPTPSGNLGGYDDNGNYVIRFNDSSLLNYITSTNNTKVTYDSGEESIKATVTSSADPSFYIDLTSCGISANNFKYMTYTYKIPSSIKREGPSGNFYYVCGNISEPTGGYESAIFDWQKNGNYCTVTVPLTNANWNGAIKGMRIDYFTDAYKDDYAFIDSLAFSTSEAASFKFGQSRLLDRGTIVPSETTVTDVWNIYRSYYTNANSNEFITGSGTNLQMYFRFGSQAKLTARSLGDRFARAVTLATGYECTATCDVKNAFLDLYNAAPKGETVPMYYTLKYKDEIFVAYVRTTIILDSNYKDALDGTSADPTFTYPNNSTWMSRGANATDAVQQTKYDSAGLIIHSNNECRMVETPYGMFAVYCTYCDSNTWSTMGTAEFTVFRLYDNGSSTALGSYSFAYHSSKPEIFYADDGNVYVFCNDCVGSDMSVFVGYFDPSKPFNMTWKRSNVSYSGGGAPGGYGYSATCLDDKNGKFYTFACGGTTSGYLCWGSYNYRTHSWESVCNTVISESYRHCYLYLFPDGNKGVYIVGGRDVLLSTLGINGLFNSVNYAWDEVNILHIPNMRSSAYTFQHVTEADYTQTDRNMYPASDNSAGGDAYITEDGYLHVLATYEMQSPPDCGNIYRYLVHAVYDVREPGQEPKLVFKKPIDFISPDNSYAAKFVENTDGHLFILAVPRQKSPRVEIWSAVDSMGSEFELIGCKNFAYSEHCHSGIIASCNSRNGSTKDNTVGLFYSCASNGRVWYTFSNVTLPTGK